MCVCARVVCVHALTCFHNDVSHFRFWSITFFSNNILEVNVLNFFLKPRTIKLSRHAIKYNLGLLHLNCPSVVIVILMLVVNLVDRMVNAIVDLRWILGSQQIRYHDNIALSPRNRAGSLEVIFFFQFSRWLFDVRCSGSSHHHTRTHLARCDPILIKKTRLNDNTYLTVVQ